MIQKNQFGGHHDADWFVGLVVFNLCTLRRVRQFIDSAEQKLLVNAARRKKVKRCQIRQGPTNLCDHSRMVAFGDQVDQNGVIETPQNIHTKSPVSKLELLRSSDSVLDGVVQVQDFIESC